MKFFDPACGSGNFLIITYKQLRLLEMDILHLRKKCTQEQMLDFIDGSCIRLKQFFGIELLDFPHEVAMLSLWLAEHQMNNKFHADFGVNVAALPLHNIDQIKCGNACRMDWEVVCPHTKDEEVFVFGNPPYLGSKLQTKEQKEDISYVFGKLKNSIIRKTKCFRILERNAKISKTKRNFSRLYPTPQKFKKIDRLRRNEIHLKAVRTSS